MLPSTTGVVKLVVYFLVVKQPNAVNTIDYITIAQTGNAVDFGDLSVAI